MEAENEILDLLIIGAGPAGCAAAVEARRQDLRVALFDENGSPGGQIYRNINEAQALHRAFLGPDYLKGSALYARLAASGAEIATGATIWMIEPPTDAPVFSVGVLQAGIARVVHARHVLIATGALERPFPIPGWTLPGVMTAGAAQTMLKSSGAVPAGPTIVAGTGPLLYLLAAQLARAKVPLVAVLDTTPHANWLRAAPHVPAFLLSDYFRKGLALLAEVSRAVRVVRGVSRIEAEGDRQLQSVHFATRARRERLDVETLLLHQGVVPQVNLTMAAGCEHRWSEERLAFEPKLDSGFRSSVPGLSIAGDTSSIGGALAAEAAGAIAVLHILHDMGRLSADDLAARLSAPHRVLRRALRGRRFIDRLYRPADAFRIPDDDVVICRCEEVTAGAVRAAANRGAQGPNQAKSFLRTGMGPCQGRLCGLTVTEVMARQLGKTPAEVGHLRIRNPVKPITLGALVALKGDTETVRLF